MGRLLAYFRLGIAVIALLLYMIKLLIWFPVSGKDPKVGITVRKQFTRTLMWILGIRVHLEGELPVMTSLIVSNHRSLIDPVVQLHFLDAVVVSKAEVEKYPILGKGAKLTGVIFVHRDKKESRGAARQAIYEALKGGRSVLIYPEGTTSALLGTREFHPGSFEIAAMAGVPVQPAVIEYGRSTDYWEDTPLLAHFIRKFSHRSTHVRLWFGEAIPSMIPEMARQDAQNVIREQVLSHMHSENFVKTVT